MLFIFANLDIRGVVISAEAEERSCEVATLRRCDVEELLVYSFTVVWLPGCPNGVDGVETLNILISFIPFFWMETRGSNRVTTRRFGASFHFDLVPRVPRVSISE